jgi:hypothetical protein
VVFEGDVTSIGRSAFLNCTSLSGYRHDPSRGHGHSGFVF